MNAPGLEELRQANIDNMDKSALVDLHTIKVDAAASARERLQQYLTGLKNPYAYRVGEISVKVEFSSGGKPLREELTNYLLTLKEKS